MIHVHELKSKPLSKEYAEGWDRIFRKKEEPRTLGELRDAVTALFGGWAAPVKPLPETVVICGFGGPAARCSPNERVWDGFFIQGRGKSEQEAIAEAWRCARLFDNPKAHEARWRKEFVVRRDRDFDSNEDRWYVGGRILVAPLP